MAFCLSDRILMAADSITVSGGLYHTDTPKIQVRHGALVGMVGSGGDEYLYWHDFPADVDILSPRVHLERWSYCKSALAPDANVELGLVIAKGQSCIDVCDMGNTQEVGTFTVIGNEARHIAQYLLNQAWRPDLTVPDCLALASRVLAEVEKASPFVQGPLVWADTVDMTVRTVADN